MVVKVYYSSVSSSKEIKKHQQSVFMVLEAKKIEFERIDISIDEEAKTFMWENSKKPESGKPLPPQIYSDDQYCGNYDDFDEANETKKLRRFLQLSDPEPLDDDEEQQ